MIAVPLFSAVVSRTLRSFETSAPDYSLVVLLNASIFYHPPVFLRVAERCGIYVGTQTNPLGVIPLTGLLLCRGSMGASESKLVFKKGIFRLSEEKAIPANDPYWTGVCRYF